jgi:hypothetical protein
MATQADIARGRALQEIRALSKESEDRWLFELAENVHPDRSLEVLSQIARAQPSTDLGKEIVRIAQEALVGEPDAELQTALAELGSIVDRTPERSNESDALKAARAAVKESRTKLETKDERERREQRETQQKAALSELEKIADSEATDPVSKDIVKAAKRVKMAQERATKRAEAKPEKKPGEGAEDVTPSQEKGARATQPGQQPAPAPRR